MPTVNKQTKQTGIDCLWLITIAFAIGALDRFRVTDHFIALGGGQLLSSDLDSLMSANHGWALLLLVHYALAIYLIYIATRIHAAIGCVFLLVLWIAMIVDMSFNDVLGKQAHIIDIVLLNSDVWHVWDIVSQHIVSISVQVLLSALLFIPLLRKSIKDKRVPRRLRIFVWPLIVMYMLYAGVFMIKGEVALQSYPKGYAYGFGTISVQMNQSFKKMQAADPFDVNTISASAVDKIIVVIDHAVNYDDFVATRANRLPEVIDYGRAFSGANCAAAANFVLRRAAWVRQGNGAIVLKDVESMFTLASKAGYKTALLDNANVLHDPVTRHYVDAAELRDIQYQIAGENALYTRDLASVEVMPDLLAHEKILIVVNKVGAHTPYANTLPPTAASGRKLYNYKKTLEFNTKGYLEKLMDVVDENTVVFYTSDHGQNLQGAMPDCNTGAEIKRTEYTVPFLVMTKHAGLKQQLMQRQSVYANKLTHLEFSESIRNIMGYSIDDIDSVFKPPRYLDRTYCGLYGPPYTVMDARPQCRGLR
jgi:glucan phosphoethanolaminetransferase (alkaline phosphatase superfamily)